MRDKIIKCRAAIRAHRDARGDDRCWVDDHAVWATIDPADDLTALPSYEEGMRLCHVFYEHRREDGQPQNTSAASWSDDDLDQMSVQQLAQEFGKLEVAIKKHRDIKDRPRTVADDRALYAVLPEKIEADFRLPAREDFLGEAKAPHAGCPSFWRSHAHCKTAHHNLHHWGLCK